MNGSANQTAPHDAGPHLAAPPETRDADPRVADLMSRQLVGIVPDAPLPVALRLMVSTGVRHLPVIAGDQCTGLVLETDVAPALAGVPGADVRWVGELCRDAPRLRPQDRRSTAAARMRDTGIDAAVVVHRGRLVGILTATDLIRSLAADQPAPLPTEPSPP